MRTLFRAAVTAFVLVAAVTSCDLLKKKGAAADASAEAAVAETAGDAAPATPAAAEPLASNENDIARFPDETKLDNVAATVARWSYVREAPVSGKPVTQLNAGQAVTKISQRDKYFLVTFDKDSKKLMGWISQDAFTAVLVDAGLKVPTCTAPEVPVNGDFAYCGRICSTDGECPSGTACKGTAQKIVNGKIADTVSVCTAFQRPDAGAPVATVDAGAPAAVDAGRPAALLPVVDPPCPPGTHVLLAKDKKCHRLCDGAHGGVGACGANRCVKCESQSVCAPLTAPNFCK